MPNLASGFAMAMAASPAQAASPQMGYSSTRVAYQLPQAAGAAAPSPAAAPVAGPAAAPNPAAGIPQMGYSTTGVPYQLAGAPGPGPAAAPVSGPAAAPGPAVGIPQMGYSTTGVPYQLAGAPGPGPAAAPVSGPAAAPGPAVGLSQAPAQQPSVAAPAAVGDYGYSTTGASFQLPQPDLASAPAPGPGSSAAVGAAAPQQQPIMPVAAASPADYRAAAAAAASREGIAAALIPHPWRRDPPLPFAEGPAVGSVAAGPGAASWASGPMPWQQNQLPIMPADMQFPLPGSGALNPDIPHRPRPEPLMPSVAAAGPGVGMPAGILAGIPYHRHSFDPLHDLGGVPGAGAQQDIMTSSVVRPVRQCAETRIFIDHRFWVHCVQAPQRRRRPARQVCTVTDVAPSRFWSRTWTCPAAAWEAR